MIPSFCHRNLQIEINLIISITLLLLFLPIDCSPSPSSSSLQIEAMRVRPLSMKRNITLRDELDPPQMDQNAPRKLRRLPHVFGKVLELPFRSDADVSIEESADSIRFVAEIEDLDFAAGAGEKNRVRAHAVEIHPGVTKVVVRNGEIGELLLEQLRVDVWRFRLPAAARPELATAVVVDGELIVAVPKSNGGVRGLRDGNGAFPRLVYVQ